MTRRRSRRRQEATRVTEAPVASCERAAQRRGRAMPPNDEESVMEIQQEEFERGRGSGRWRGARLLAVVATLLLAGGLLAACGDDDDDDGEPAAEEATISGFAVVTPEEANDYGWNQQAVEGAEQVASELGIELEVADGAGYEDTASILRELSTTGGVEFIAAHASGYNTISPEVAAQTGVPAVAWDNPEANEPGVSREVTTASQEGAYLAGVLAAESTEAGHLGIVISADDNNWHLQSGGFVAGARSVDPEIEISLAQIGEAGYADAAGGRRVTNAEIDDEGVLLSSVLWSFDGYIRDSIEAIADGTFGEESYVLDLENGGIGLLRTDLIDDELWNELEDIKQQIIDGEIDVPATATRSKVEDLIRG